MRRITFKFDGDYSDKGFGLVMDSMVRQASRDVIISFRQYTCWITRDDSDPELFSLVYGIRVLRDIDEELNDQDGTLLVSGADLYSETVDDPNNVGHRLITRFRAYFYFEQDEMFPIEELRISFVNDYQNYVFIQDADTSIDDVSCE